MLCKEGRKVCYKAHLEGPEAVLGFLLECETTSYTFRVYGAARPLGKRALWSVLSSLPVPLARRVDPSFRRPHVWEVGKGGIYCRRCAGFWSKLFAKKGCHK